MTEVVENTHIGHKIQRVRELKGVKQETLAKKLGVTRQAVSKIEQSQTVEEQKLEQIALALDVSTDTIKNFTEAAVNYINSFYDSSKGDFNYSCIFNPIDKIVELFEENKNLYERMLETERSKIKLLEDQLKSLKK